jgi:hypothetical protein
LDVVEFDWNENAHFLEYEYLKETNRLHSIGLIAQNVKKYFPEVVALNQFGYYFVDYSKLNAVVVEAIKEQQIDIDKIIMEVSELEKFVNG